MNGFRDYEKYIAYQKTPLVGQSLSLVSWISVLLALSRTLFLHLFLLFCSNILCSIVILFLSLFNKRKKKNQQAKQSKVPLPLISLGTFPFLCSPLGQHFSKTSFYTQCLLSLPCQSSLQGRFGPYRSTESVLVKGTFLSCPT